MENSSTSSTRARSPNPVSEITGENDTKIRANSTKKNDEKTVKITVQKENTKDVALLVKRNAALGKLMLNYCLQMGLDDKVFKFTYMGVQVKDHETPLALNMEDEDVIDCWSDLVGGRGRGRG